MITWRYTKQPVFAKLSFNLEHVRAQLIEIKRRRENKPVINEFGFHVYEARIVAELIFLDTNGRTKYCTASDYVIFELPPMTIPTKHIRDLMNIEDD